MLTRHRPVDADLSSRLDMLRGLSAIAVLVGHAFQVFMAPLLPGLLSPFVLLAQAAVMLFFVLSGFLITKSITRRASGPGGFDVAAYAGDRLDRILPPLLLALLLVLVLLAATRLAFPTGSSAFLHAGGFVVLDGFAVDPLAFAGTLLFLNGFATGNIAANGPLWSLAFEVWYYVIAGLIAWRPRLGGAIGLAVFVALGSANRAFALYALVWLGGAAAALADDHRLELQRPAKLLALLGLAAAGLIGYRFCSVAAGALDPAGLPWILLEAFNPACGIAFAAIFHLMTTGRWRLPVVAPGTAAFSYTLYVAHVPLLLFVYGTVQPLIHRSIGSAPWSRSHRRCWRSGWRKRQHRSSSGSGRSPAGAGAPSRRHGRRAGDRG